MVFLKPNFDPNCVVLFAGKGKVCNVTVSMSLYTHCSDCVLNISSVYVVFSYMFILLYFSPLQ